MRAWWSAAAVGAVLLSAPLTASAQCDQQLESGDVLVTSIGTGRVYCFDRPPPQPAAPVTPLPVPTGSAFGSPRGLAVDRNGLLLVTDNGPKTLVRVDPSRDLQGLAAQFSTVSSALRGVVSASDGRVFVADPGIVPLVEPPLPPIRGITYFPRVIEVNVSDGVTIGVPVAGCTPLVPGIARCGNLYLPTGLAIEREDPEVVLLVADGGEPAAFRPGRIHQGVIRVFADRPLEPPIVDPDVYPAIGTNDEPFCAPGPFATPRSLTIDRSPGREGSVLVTDSGDAASVPPVPARIYRVSPEGCNDLSDPPVEKVAEAQGLVRPIGIAVADDGTIFVADATADTVFRIDPDTDPEDLDDNGTGSASPFSSVGSIDQAWDLQIQRAQPGAYFVADASAPVEGVRVPALLAIEPAVPSRSTVTSGGSLVEPAALEVLPAAAGLLVADPTTRAVIEAALAGAQRVASQTGRLVAPTSASREAGGPYLVTDPGDAAAVPPLAPAVIRVDPTQVSPGNQSIVAEAGKLVRPMAGAIDGNGFLIVADAGAGTAADPPRIVRIAPGPGVGSGGQATLFEGPPLFSPVALALDEGGGVILLADRGDATHPPAVLRLVRSGDPPGEIAFVVGLASADLLETPAGLAIDTDRSIRVTDGGDAANADDGKVIRVDALSGFQSAVATAGTLDEPTGIGVRAPAPGPYLDQDADGIADAEDNCLAVANTEQIDTDGNRIGNACDPDFDDDGVVGTADFIAVRRAFGSGTGDPTYDPELDVDGDDVVGTAEFLLVRSCFGALPGVSGLLSFEPQAGYCRPALPSP